MGRPKSQHPTPAELEVLKIVWETGPCLVRDVLEALNSRGKNLAYTTVMTRMNRTMTTTKILSRPEALRQILSPVPW